MVVDTASMFVIIANLIVAANLGNWHSVCGWIVAALVLLRVLRLTDS